MSSDLRTLFSEALSGNLRAIGRLLTALENPYEVPPDVFDEIMARAGRAHVIGITGIPGAGKSTIISRLVREYRRQGLRDPWGGQEHDNIEADKGIQTSGPQSCGHSHRPQLTPERRRATGG